MLQVEPVHEVFGARIAGLDVSALNDATLEEVRDVAARYGFALFEGQRLGPHEFVALARRFGEPLPGYRPEFTHPEYPELVLLGNIRDNGQVVTYLNTQGVEWHSDATGSVLAPNVTMLYAAQAPRRGGDTLFGSAVAAYESLAPEMKRRLGGLQVVHSFDHHNDRVATFDGTNVVPRDEGLRKRNPDLTEPVVQVHPRTGQRHLFLSHQMVKEVVGMSAEDGMALVMELVGHMTQPRNVYRHHWSPGELIVFDNRSAIHSATAYDYADERRLMYQCIIGQRPQPARARRSA